MKGTGKKYEDNVDGKYYVVDTCNACGLCFSVALQKFMYSNDSSYYYVYQQPADLREEVDVQEAITICPMDAIKDDGDSMIANEQIH